MADKCAWFINLDENDTAARLAAAQLGPYGLAVKGQRWPTEDKAWLSSAQEAADAGAAVVLAIGSPARQAEGAVRRGLALFRLALQTRLGRPVNGFALVTGEPDGAGDASMGNAILGDWARLDGTRWQAKVVARAHAPIAPPWPVRLGLHAHERLGIWLETHPAPGKTAAGALVGVAGNAAKIDFHAVGPAGGMPERSVNEYELQGLQFEAAGQAFQAWGLRNAIAPDHSYYVRLDGEPDTLAIGALPDGELEDVSLIAMG
ncbi:hypothetical protein [Castellaniella sp. GW247-6E4]|uniref:hypothetical protein n=1 Tax=Castellaniella sp. GW247-6E4 TaxID=3140380 RepID=UPI0033156577